MVAELKKKYIQIVDDLSENEYLMYIVLREIDNAEYRSLHNTMFEILFGKPNEAFMKMINASKEGMTKIIEDNSGELTFFGRHYSRVSA